MIEVSTPNGWSEFDGIRKTKEREIFKLNVEDRSLSGTREHLVKTEDGFASLESVGAKTTDVIADVYDILGVEKDKQYYTNGVISHNCVFRGSQNSLLSGATLERLVVTDPIVEKDDNIKVYKEPEDGHAYIICVDVSRGIGGDYHAMTVIDISTSPFEVVCTFRDNRMSPLILPNLIYNVAIEYNDANVLIEINDIGEQVSNILYFDLEYENLIMTRPENNKQIIGFGHNAKTGVRTTQAVKAIGTSNIKTMIEKEKIILNDHVIIDELGTFIPKGKSYEADTGAHDDMVMTLVLFAWATTQTYFIELTDQDFRQQLLREQEDRAMEEIMPFGFIENDFSQYDGKPSGHFSI